MPNYVFKAKDIHGKIEAGDINVENISDFYLALKERGLYCISYRESSFQSQRVRTIYKMKNTELIMFCRKLSAMLKSGMGMNAAFDVLYSTSDHKKMQNLYTFVYENIQKGQPLSDAMKSAGKSFPQLLVNMVESGEASGNIDEILSRMSLYYEKQNKLAQKVKAATIYPVILLVVSTVIVIILFTFVLPTLFGLFQGQELPPLTVAIMNISNFLTENYVLLIILVPIVIIAIKALFSLPRIRLSFDKIKLGAPIFGKLVKKIYSSQFSSAIAMLYSSGIPLLNAVKLSSNVIQNTFIRNSFVSVAENISKGENLSSSIEDVNVFDKMLPSMIKIGEESGSLDTILQSTAEYYDMEAENAISRILSLLEPILLATMAIVIGMILVSVIQPIYGMYSVIS